MYSMGLAVGKILSALHAKPKPSRVPIHFMLWTALTLALTFALMPAVKGAVVGLQWALRMHGFDYAAQAEHAREGE